MCRVRSHHLHVELKPVTWIDLDICNAFLYTQARNYKLHPHTSHIHSKCCSCRSYTELLLSWVNYYNIPTFAHLLKRHNTGSVCVCVCVCVWTLTLNTQIKKTHDTTDMKPETITGNRYKMVWQENHHHDFNLVQSLLSGKEQEKPVKCDWLQ
jgi:hypothetical protein